MKADYQSYKRATSVSLLGLVLQLAMGLTLLVYSFVARSAPTGPGGTGSVVIGDLSARTGALYILLGSVVWLLLAIVFDQHRRERIEQMEIEALNASGARDSSAFSEVRSGADEFRVAHRRLVWLHKFAVPVVSLLYGGALIGLGFWTYYEGKAVLKPGVFQSSGMFGVVISIALGVAFVGFVFARYVAGMAKQPVWSHLRAGAGVAVGAAIFGLLTMAAQFIDKWGPPEPVMWLHVVWPCVMIFLGVEVILSFLLGMYSPRKPGEFPRAPLDSKVLSFAAAPDRIAASIGEALNYQFGFDVTGNWFYQLLTRSVTALVLAGVLVVWLLSCIAVVQPNEQGIDVRMGKILRGPLGPGPYVKLPWPFEKVETYQTSLVRRLDLGVLEPNLKGKKSILWTNDHGVDEKYFLVRPGAGEEGESLGGRDLALVSLELPLYYVVEDYARFYALGTPEQAESQLQAIARRQAVELVASMRIDDVIGAGRAALSATLKKRVEAEFAKLGPTDAGGKPEGAGVRVVFVGVEGAHPPRDTSAAFEDVVKAKQIQRGALETAEKEANSAVIEVAGSLEKAHGISVAIDELNGLIDAKADAAKINEKRTEIEELLVRAGGTAASTIQEARAARWERHMSARAAADAFVGQMAGFQSAPEVYVSRLYFDTLKAALKNTRVYIVSDDQPTHVNMNLEDLNTGGNLFVAPKKEE
ncbi:MAG TPA: SPFH domain-containing protein [Phycisphaerales bacterium]|nr:SPFH domain-containing protein [Phycisphaerales bacterium]